MNDKGLNLAKQWSASTVSWTDDKLVISHEIDYPREIVSVDKMMHEVAKTDEHPFSVANNRGRSFVQMTDLGRRFLASLQVDVYGIKRTFNKHKLSPYFTLFASHVAERKYPVPKDLRVETVDEFNKWIDALRAEARAAGFAKQVDDQERAMRKNAASLLAYLRKIHEAHAKLVAVRLDLGYSKQFREEKDQVDISPMTVKQHLKGLLKFLRQRFPNLVGYVWKLEYGTIKSYHYHLMLIFNGHEVREDISLGQLVGEHWVDEVTGGIGTYWNCNARKEVYEHLGLLGIGTIRYDDVEARQNLERAALYLAKVDYYVRLNAPGIGRTFGKGVLRPLSETRRGRPRAKQSAVPQQAPRPTWSAHP